MPVFQKCVIYFLSVGKICFLFFIHSVVFQDQKLDDEVRLPNIQFTEECQNDSLDEIQQAAVLAIL